MDMRIYAPQTFVTCRLPVYRQHVLVPSIVGIYTGKKRQDTSGSYIHIEAATVC